MSDMSDALELLLTGLAAERVEDLRQMGEHGQQALTYKRQLDECRTALEGASKMEEQLRSNCNALRADANEVRDANERCADTIRSLHNEVDRLGKLQSERAVAADHLIAERDRLKRSVESLRSLVKPKHVRSKKRRRG